MDILILAAQFREALKDFAANQPDDRAAHYPSLFEPWIVGEEVAIDDRRYYAPTGKLYKCKQAHTTQSNWTPDVTNALWTVIDIVHSGTLEDPIIAERGMEYEYGCYYLDPEDNKVYLCERTGEEVGNKIVLQYLPHELIGNYFTEV